MCVECNSVLSTPEADKIGHFGQYQYIGETQISARLMYQSSSKCWYSRCFSKSTVSPPTSQPAWHVSHLFCTEKQSYLSCVANVPCRQQLNISVIHDSLSKLPHFPDWKMCTENNRLSQITYFNQHFSYLLVRSKQIC